jgi:hypothetical protein
MTANTYISIADDPRLDNKPIWYRQKIGIPCSLWKLASGEQCLRVGVSRFSETLPRGR